MTTGRSWRGAAVISAVGLAVLVGSGGSGAETLTEPVASAAVQVTANPSPVRAHSSPQIARNPTNGELVVAGTDIQIGKRCSVHLSTDEGRSWSPGGDPMMAPYTDCSTIATNGPYFTLEFDSDGVLYMVFQASDPKLNALVRTDRARHVFVARSTDSGRTFTTSFVYRVPDGLVDDPRNTNRRPMVAVDPNNHLNVYYASSVDGGQTFSKNVRVSDRSIDRSIGVWSNNVHSATTVGITSTDSAVYFAWQDSRNGNPLTNTEDAYFALLRLESEDDDGSSSVPGALLLGSGLLLGMGLAMLAVWLTSSRRSTG